MKSRRFPSFLSWRIASLLVAGLATSAAASSCSGSGSASGGIAGSDAAGPTGSGADGFGGALSGTGSMGIGGGCANSTIKADKIPLDVYVMLDQSGSMNDKVASGSTKWQAVTSALAAFVNQPQTVGVGVGIQYFGLRPSGIQCPLHCMSSADCGACGACVGALPPNPGTCFAGDSCNAADYAKPDVEIAPLPGGASAIIASMTSHSPSTSTPTSPAVEGAVDHAKAWAQMNPSHVVIALLASDGIPSECDTDLNHINAIAAAAATGMPKILTFVIGVGSSLGVLNGIAAAGGTSQAYLIDTNQNAQEQFLDALNAIQGTALGCTYSIPQPEMGTLDYGKVNVEYTPVSGMSTAIPKVPSKADCPPGGDGWYYDSDAAPTTIILCDDTCTKISGDVMGRIDVVFGCTSIIK